VGYPGPSRWSAVARGAVCRGLEAAPGGLVAMRLSRKHFGTPVSTLYNPAVHSEADLRVDEYTGRRMASGQMIWLVDKRARLPEDNPKTMTIEVSAHFSLDEEREVGAILCGCSEDIAPTRFVHNGKSLF
jgi:hypothetical protein